jgi:hypothetical protein
MVQRRNGGQRRPRGAVKKYVPKPPTPPSEHARNVENEFRAQYGISRAIDYAHGAAAQAEAARTMPPEEAAAILRARAGDDSALFPYTPTPSINPPRPRTQAAGYSRDTETLRVKFRSGAVYEYYDVPQNVWRNFQRVKSPGKLINRTLNQYSYARRPDLEA